jgi:hypothetical protein
VRRVATPAIAFVAGGATVLLALGLAWRAAPGVVLADDMAEALEIVAATPLSAFPRGSVVYLKSALGPVLLERLQPRYPSLTLRSYSERPPPGCAGRDSPAAPCEHDDFLKLEVLSAPTRGTLLVAVGTARAYGQVLLVRFLGRWRVLLQRSYTA